MNSQTNELGIDPDSSLNTDVITGDALLDLPDNEDDLLAYLTQLAQLRGGDGTVTLSVDGFTDANLPPLAQIAEIRIVNSSFSADGSTGPRIEIVTTRRIRKMDCKYNGQFQRRIFQCVESSRYRKTAAVSEPECFGQLQWSNYSRTFEHEYQCAEPRKAILPEATFARIRQTDTFRTESHPSMRKRTFTISPRLMINKVHNLTSNFSYRTNHTDNSGVGGLTLPERASNNKTNNWQLQLSDRMTKGKMVDTLRFSAQHNTTRNTPVGLDPAQASSYGAYIVNPITGLPYTINVSGSFNGGIAPNNTHNTTQNFLLGNTMQWQAKPKLTFSAIAFELQYHKNDSDNRNNYNGTYTFPGLYDYCATLSVGFFSRRAMPARTCE